MTLLRRRYLRGLSDRELKMQKKITEDQHRIEHLNKDRIKDEMERRKARSR